MLLRQAIDSLLEQVSQWQLLGKLPLKSDNNSIVCLSSPVAKVPSLEWLNAQDCYPKFFWSPAQNLSSFAGVGEAWRVSTKGQQSSRDVMDGVQQLLKDATPEVCFMGGRRFNSEGQPGVEWSKWPDACFILPRVVLKQNEHESRLMAFIPRFSQTDESKALEELRACLLKLSDKSTAISSTHFAYHQRREVVKKEHWDVNIGKILDGIRADRLQKVVLARAVDFVFNANAQPSPLELLQGLRGLAPDAFHFCIELDKNEGFVGASPELLYHRYGKSIRSEALAGTTSKEGKDLDENLALIKALQSNDKERREHLWVLQYLEAKLKPLCKSLQRVSLMEGLKWANAQHLRSRLEGTLKDGVEDADLLYTLHSTPAVCGVPQSKARDLIQSIEGFDRGWYAGTIGCVSRGETILSVALRCGLLFNNLLRVYAGAGIVSGSEKSKEWNETAIKMGNWAKLLQGIVKGD